MNELPIAPIDRLIRKSGAERVSEDASEAMAGIISEFVNDLSSQAYKLKMMGLDKLGLPWPKF